MSATTKGPKFVVRCADYTTKAFRTREAAEAAMARIEAEGHCHRAHEVAEVER